jgi:dCMP deaminase
MATHAEQNALLQCRDVEQIDTCYTTASPCITCVKLLMNTGCRSIVFAEEYPHPEAMDLWLSGYARFAPPIVNHTPTWRKV